MNRKTFIQNASMHLLSDLMAGKVDADQVIRACERLWERLSERGYGADQKKELVPTEGYFASMEKADQDLFLAFWEAYGKHGRRDQAASAWLKIKDRESLAKTITVAAGIAKREWEREPGNRNRTRIYAQGWLSARGWEDHEDQVKSAQVRENSADVSAVSAAELANLNADHRWLREQGANEPGHKLYDQFVSVSTRLSEIRTKAKGGSQANE